MTITTRMLHDAGCTIELSISKPDRRFAYSRNDVCVAFFDEGDSYWQLTQGPRRRPVFRIKAKSQEEM